MKRRDPSALLFSVAIHVVLATAILTAAFHYDFASVPAAPHIPPPIEKLTYVNVAPAGGVTGGSDTSSQPARSNRPARGLVAPVTIPTAIVPVTQPTGSQPGGVEGGKGKARESSVVTGVVPSQYDPRLGTDLHAFYPLPKTHAERVDSAVRASIYAYNDSIARALAMRGRAPGDWTFGKDGQKWGMDGRNIYLGKFAIPSAVLAALPLRLQGNPGEGLSDRLAPSRRADLLIHADAAFHDEEFKDAVKRIRERKDRERADKANDAAKTVVAGPDLIP